MKSGALRMKAWVMAWVALRPPPAAAGKRFSQ